MVNYIIMEMINSIEDTSSSSYNSQDHPLIDKWVLWAHLPHNTDWSLKSYIKLQHLQTVEDVVSITNAIPEKMVKNCMLFLMKNDIKPTWEDPGNIAGGSFSFKVSNKVVHDIWNNLFYTTIGQTISNDVGFVNTVNGITISPKKNFCIIKIWTNNCSKQNPALIDPSHLNGLNLNGCLFKKHIAEY